jgi:hypothetical protein
MDLLERYLQAVGQYLDLDTKEDMLAELRANLMGDMDARADQLGRSLTESEIAAILQAHGRPVLVAARYLPQRYLIGPALFLVYLFTLRKAAPMVALIFFLASSSVALCRVRSRMAGLLCLIPNRVAGTARNQAHGS